MLPMRKYNFKSVDMLLASKAIVQSLSDHLDELSAIRSNWTPEYVQQLSEKIDVSIDQYLGLDKKKELREMTRKLASIQEPATRDLSFLKTQIEVDFGEEATDILRSLGFYGYYAEVRNGEQEAMIELLSAFKKGLTESIRQRIIEKGTSPALLDRIVGYADQMIETNVSQESLKATTKELTAEALESFNQIYEEAIGICKIAANYYLQEPLKKDLFTFSRVVDRMGISRTMEPMAEEV